MIRIKSATDASDFNSPSRPGVSANNCLCQFQADMEQIKSLWQQERCFHLNKSQEKADECLRGWRKAVVRAKSWART